MAKNKAEWENKSRFKYARSAVAIGIVLVVAAALILTGVLLTVVDRGGGAPSVSAINLESEKIGMTADLNNVFVKIVYSDGSSRSVALSELMPEGLDLTYAGLQNVTINYGNQQWSIPIEVVSSKIKIQYVTSDGGYVEGDSYQEIPAGESGATVRAVANEGYHFVSWDDGVLSETRSERSVSQNKTVRALFERNSYTVAFQRADGRWDEQTVLYGDPAVPPAADTWKMRNYGYKFLRWDESVAGDLESVTRDLLVRGEYEQFHSNFSISVTGNPDNVKDRTVSAANHTYGSDAQTEDKNGSVSYVLDGKSYTRRANVYSGFYEWQASPSSVIAVNAAQDSVLDCWLVKMQNGQWQKIEAGGSATVLLPGGGGDSSDMVEFSAANADNGVYKLTFTLQPLVNKDAVLEVVAVMEYRTNDIMFYNRADHVKTVALPYNETLKTSDFPTLEMTGYDFDGWYIRNTDTEVTTENYFKEATIVDARWTPKRYNVEFTVPQECIDNGFAPRTVVKEYLSTIGRDFPPTSPRRDGYDFAGWFVAGASGGAAVTEATVVYGNMTLEPRFTPKRHVIKFEVSGGSARITVSKDGGAAEAVGSGTFTVEEPSSYAFTVEWNSEYVLSSLAVDGNGVSPAVSDNSFTLNFNKGGTGGAYTTESEHMVNITLADKEFKLDFVNGAADVNGTVTVSGDYGATSNKERFTVSVPMHAQVLYTVVAPKGYVINRLTVTVDGEGEVVAVSPNAAEYTGLLGDFNADCVIEVSYEKRIYSLTVKDGDRTTSYDVTSENPFEYAIAAPENKYAVSVTLNGRAVDLYRFAAPSADAYYIDRNGFTVNMRGASAKEIAERDARVTGATFKIDSVSEDFALIIEYADLEYTLKFDSTGYGRVLSEKSVSVKRGDGWAAVLTTDTGYYIAGYRVSVYNPATGEIGTETVNYNSFSTNYTEEITNVTEDAEYTFIFARREFGIIFAASRGSVSIEKDGETTVLSGSALAEFAVPYGGSARFEITVAENKIIDRVYLISDGGTTEELETGEVESSYSLVLDKVKDGMRVVVFVAEKPEISGDGALVIEKTVGGKIASASGGRYTAGQAAEFTVIPESGYEIKSVVVSSAGKFSRAITAAGIINGKFSVSAEDTTLAGGADIRVSPVFAPKNFDIELKIEEANRGRLDGQGKIAVGPEKDSAADKIDAVGSFTEKAVYGSNYYIYFIAADDCIISQIRIDGVPVELDSSNLEYYTVAAGGYSVARIAVKVAGDTVVSVSFIKETFTATVATSYNGTTEIVNAADGFLKGEDVLIGMTADTGYHISALYIDGIKIDESLYLDFSGDDAKLNTSAKYTYLSITRSITVVAQYEMNYYTLGFRAVNVSDNFAAVNTAFGSYGSITAEYSNGGTPLIVSEVDGQAEYNATYGGIAHGSTATLNIRAAYESGYYIRNLTVRMLSGGTTYELIKDGAMGVYDENAPCYATAAGIRDGIVYGAAVGVRGDGGISADVYSVYVEFARTKFKVRTFFGEGADSENVGISFVNSYNNGQAAFYETNVDASGVYYVVEFGIQATVSVNPLEKFRLSSLSGADGTDYTYNVIGNRYTGLIARDVSFIATYEVRQMNVTLTVGGEEYGSANIDGFSGGTATVPYGSPIRFILIPDASRGGITDGLRINGGAVTLVEENGVYYYVVGEITSDIEAEAYFAIKKYSATQTVNVSAGGSVGLTDANGNNLNNDEIAWGQTLVATITVNRAYNLVSVTVNGSPYHIEDLEYEELNGIRRYILTIDDVRENYAVSVNFALKTFDWEASFNEARGDVFIGDEAGNKLSVLTANDDVYLYVKPFSGFMVSTVSARMQGFDGNYSALTLDGERYDSVNLDLRRYKIDDVTGRIAATVSLAQKEFDLKIESLIGFDGMDRLSLTVRRSNVIMGSIELGYWNSSVIRNVRFGDEITLIMKASTGYDMVGVSVNGREYLAGRNVINYNVSSDEFSWTVAVDDELVNNRDGSGNLVVGGDTSFNIDFAVAAERDSFTVVLSGNYEGIADVSVSASITFGSRNSIIVTAHEGYSVTSVKIGHPLGYATGNYEWLTVFDERSPVAELEIVTDGSYGVFHYDDSTGVMTKRIFIEVDAEINSYNQQVSEYVHDNDPKTTDVSETDKIASTLTAYYINKEGAQVNLAYATAIEHFTEVTVETNHTLPQEYEFWGFQEYIAGIGWTGEIENISYAGGSRNKFTYTVDRARNFRAVYVKKYTVEVEIVPFHKYLSGSYIPETGTFMNYATYGSIGAAVTDPFGLGTSTAQNVSSTNANFVYEVCFGDALSVTAADSNTQNRSRSVNYYAENADGTLTLLSSGSMGMSLTVDKDMKIFAAFDNNLQFAFTTEEIGGEQKGEGATVEFSVNGSNKYLQNNSVAVAAFDRVSVRVTLADNYRFEGLYALEAKNRGELGTLIWTSTWKPLFDFAAAGDSGVVNDLDTTDKITHTQNGNVLTFEFVATENAIYKLVLHRMFTVSVSETNGYDAFGTAVTVAGGASIGDEVKNNAAPDGWFDYGATLVLNSSSVENSQFVGWFVNGTNYFDLGASLMWRNDSRENHEFTLSGDRVSGAKHLDIVAEYLPIFNLSIYRGLEFNGKKFYGSTGVTSVNAVEYRNSSISITKGTPKEAEELFDVSGGSLEMLTHIVSFAEKDNLSKVSNTVSLVVRPNASFVFSDWSVKIGGGNWEKIEGSNDTEYEFDLVSYLYGKGLATESDGVANLPRDIHFRANLAKKNVVRVSKVVYYDAFGVISPSNGLADNRAFVGDSNSQTVSTVDYGTEVTVNVQAGRDYRFLGWYDITDGDTNGITEIGDMTLTAVSNDASYTLNLTKGAAEAPVEGYTYYLEARFMREVTVTFAVENNSANGNESFKYQVPVVRGTAAAEINYAGEVVTTADTSDVNTANGSSASARHSVTLKKDAGTYVSYILPTDVTLDGYSPANHKYLGLASGSYVERGTDGEYYVTFDRNRTITVLYGAYGTINLEDILPHATVTFGETFTNLYLDRNSGSPAIDTAEYSVSVSGARLVVRNKTADSITVPLPNMPKIDYQTDRNSPAAAGYEKVDVHILPMAANRVLSYDVAIGFSYSSEEKMTLSYSLADFGQMPFSRGAGTQDNPYIVSNVEQFKNVGRVYELSGNTFGATYRHFAMETLMRNGSLIPESQKFMYLNENGEDWTPLCAEGNGFNGTFDFKDWEIGGLTGTVSDNYFGVFAKLNGATIKSFNFGGRNNVTGTADYVGFITGYAIDTTFDDVNVKDNRTRFLDGNTSVGTIGTTGDYLGLVAGYAENCVINNGIYIYAATVAGGGESDVVLGETVLRRGRYVGAMFGYLKNTDIGTTSANMTIGVNNVTVGGHRYVGGVCGYFDGNGRILRNASIISGTFGTQGISGDVGGIAGYVSAGARVENATASQSSDSNFVTVNGAYRNISSLDIENNNIELYLYNNADGEVQNARGASSVGGFIGRLDGTLDGAEIGGAMQIFGSIAGGMIGFNRGTARNLRITDSARITFDLRYGGVYGGMAGYNAGLVSHAVIGRLNKFQGLSEDMGRLVNYQNDIVKDANIIFKTEGSASVIQGSGASSIYSPASGKLFDEWGGLAMGGVVGYNLSKVYNSVTYGKIVHYKKVNSGSAVSDALGGVVGMDRGSDAEVRACGASYGMVISYTVINVSNGEFGSHSAAVGGVVGNHAGGIAVALFSFHTAVSSFTNAGVPGEGGYIPSVLRVAVGVGGVLAGIPGTATARSYISWAYYNEKSYDGSNYGPFMLGSSNAVQSSTFLKAATEVDGQNTGNSGNYNNRFNILPTDYNYNTFVNSNNGYVFNTKAKAATLGDFRYAAAEDVTRAGYRVRDYFDAYAKVYAVNDEGRPTSTLVPWQYDSDNNR